MKKLTVVILAHNEETNIRHSLESVSFTDKIIVIDDHSQDNTAKLAKQLNAKVVSYTGKDDFAQRRNFALSQSDTDWVLFVDADEVVSPELAREVAKLPDDPPESAFFIRRVDFFWEQKITHGELWNARFARLVNRKSGNFVRAVHEVWKSEGKTGNLQGLLLHYPHPTIKEFLLSVNRYSTLNAHVFLQEKRSTNALDILCTPLLKFLFTYFLRLGFLDGFVGFVYSFMMSFHSFLTRAKLYLLLHEKNG